MKANLLKLAAGAVLAVAAIPAANADPADCQTAQFSEEVLAKFPRIKEACLDIINKDGQDYAVVKADLVRTRPGAATIRPKLPDGTRAETRVVRVSPGFRVLVDGQETRVEDLAVGQELTAYVKVTQPQMALAPAQPTAAIEESPMEEPTPVAEEPTASAMPTTASPFPAIGLAGFALLLVGTLLAVARRRSARP
jgi:hypothetical protein